MRSCEVADLGRITYAEALERQRELIELRKRGEIGDRLLFVEHPHVITLGRNGRTSNLLASADVLARAGVGYYETNRGGDITYHGPGQVVAYPVFDLREWKRDVVAYVRALEALIVRALRRFDIDAEPVAGCTGVWVGGRKIAAIGVHISRWVTSHGLALNVSTDLSYFQYIVPCGLDKPVTSMRELGCDAGREEVVAALAAEFSREFNFEIMTGLEEPALVKG